MRASSVKDFWTSRNSTTIVLSLIVCVRLIIVDMRPPIIDYTNIQGGGSERGYMCATWHMDNGVSQPGYCSSCRSAVGGPCATCEELKYVSCGLPGLPDCNEYSICGS